MSETTEVKAPTFNPFGEWEEQVQENTQEQTQEQTQVKQEIVEEAAPASGVDYNQYLKDKFGFENEETALNEFQKLKENKSFQFENESSEKFFNLLKDGKEDDVYSFLSEKKKIENLINSNVDNAETAAEIVKFNLQKKYSDLSDDEIEHKFNKQFSIPSKPEQDLDETDDEYDEKLSKWEKQKALAEKELMIEAKLLKPELDKYKPNLVLPEFNKQDLSNEPSAEELEAYNKARSAYEQNLESQYKLFNGISVTAKNEEVELPVSFTPSEEEKVALKEKLLNFNQEEYFASRWVKDDGSVKVEQVMKDIFLLENYEKAHQKIANEVASKTLEHLIKSRSNLNINNERQTTYAPQKNEQAEMANFFFSQT